MKTLILLAVIALSGCSTYDYMVHDTMYKRTNWVDELPAEYHIACSKTENCLRMIERKFSECRETSRFDNTSTYMVTVECDEAVD